MHYIDIVNNRNYRGELQKEGAFLGWSDLLATESLNMDMIVFHEVVEFGGNDVAQQFVGNYWPGVWYNIDSEPVDMPRVRHAPNALISLLTSNPASHTKIVLNAQHLDPL